MSSVDAVIMSGSSRSYSAEPQQLGYEEEELKGGGSPQLPSPPHTAESSDAEVGSLIDCLEDEEEEDNISLTDDYDDAVMADPSYSATTDQEEEDAEGGASDNLKKSTGRMTGAVTDGSHMNKHRQETLREIAARQMAKPPTAPLPLHHNPNVRPLPTPSTTLHPPPPKHTVPAPATAILPRLQHPDGGMIAFNLNEPWQRSMLKQLEQVEAEEDLTVPKRSCERIYVGHTDSRDYAVSWDDDNASAFSLDTTASSATTAAPMRIQFVHRMMMAAMPPSPNPAPAPPPPTSLEVIGNRHHPSQHHHHPYNPHVHNNNNGGCGTPPPPPEGRDDCTQKVGATSPRTVTDYPNAPSSQPVPPQLRHDWNNKNRHMGQHMSEYENSNNSNNNNNLDDSFKTNDTYNTIGTTSVDPACYCLGYNMLDYLLMTGHDNNNNHHHGGSSRRNNSSSRRLSSRPLTRVVEDEEPLEQQHLQQLLPQRSPTTTTRRQPHHAVAAKRWT